MKDQVENFSSNYEPNMEIIRKKIKNPELKRMLWTEASKLKHREKDYFQGKDTKMLEAWENNPYNMVKAVDKLNELEDAVLYCSKKYQEIKKLRDGYRKGEVTWSERCKKIWILQDYTKARWRELFLCWGLSYKKMERLLTQWTSGVDLRDENGDYISCPLKYRIPEVRLNNLFTALVLEVSSKHKSLRVFRGQPKGFKKFPERGFVSTTTNLGVAKDFALDEGRVFHKQFPHTRVINYSLIIPIDKYPTEEEAIIYLGDLVGEP